MLRGWPSAEHPSCRVPPLTLERILWLRKRRRRRRRRRKRPRRRRRSNESFFFFARVEPRSARASGGETKAAGKRPAFLLPCSTLSLRRSALAGPRRATLALRGWGEEPLSAHEIAERPVPPRPDRKSDPTSPRKLSASGAR